MSTNQQQRTELKQQLTSGTTCNIWCSTLSILIIWLFVNFLIFYLGFDAIKVMNQARHHPYAYEYLPEKDKCIVFLPEHGNSESIDRPSASYYGHCDDIEPVSISFVIFSVAAGLTTIPTIYYIYTFHLKIIRFFTYFSWIFSIYWLIIIFIFWGNEFFSIYLAFFISMATNLLLYSVNHQLKKISDGLESNGNVTAGVSEQEILILADAKPDDDNKENIVDIVGNKSKTKTPKSLSLWQSMSLSKSKSNAIDQINIDNLYDYDDVSNDICDCDGDYIYIKKCNEIKRIVSIVKSFEILISNQSSGYNIIKEIHLLNILNRHFKNIDDDNDPLIELIDDYNHILESHSDDLSFIYIYNEIYENRIKKCDLNTCKATKWNIHKDNKKNKDLADDFKYEFTNGDDIINNGEEQKEGMNHEYEWIESVLKKCDPNNYKTYLDNFKTQAVKDDTIELLNDSELKELIPLMGIRKLFRKELDIKMKENDNNIPNINNQNIVLFSTFFTIHRYFIHSYDTGYRIKQIPGFNYQYTVNNLDNNNKDHYQAEIEITNDQNTIKACFDNIKSMKSQRSVKKFYSDVNLFHDIDKKDDQKDDATHIYDYGINWLYWIKYKNSKYYVTANHSSFKQELLNNKISRISLCDWNNAVKKAQKKLKSKRGKKIKHNGRSLNDFDGVSDKISTQHIISLLFYCNYDTLQFEFKKTFRRTTKSETFLDIKNRNSSFGFWSKLIRECIELFGIKMRDKPHIKFYHGLTAELVFRTTISRFNAPTSFTISLAVAINFSNNSGIILEISSYSLDVPFFDCQWISDYSSEEEKLVCGGYGSFKISNILSLLNKQEYRSYLKAINVIISFIEDRRNPEKRITRNIVNIIKSLFNIKDSNHIIPEYPLKLFECITNNWCDCICISLPRLSDPKFYLKLKDIFIDDNWMNIELLTNIFIKCPKITICGSDLYGNDGIVLTNNSLNKIFLLLQKQQLNRNIQIKHYLNQIVLESPNETKLKGNDAIKKWKQKFESINFHINYEIGNNGISSIFITKTDDITVK